MVTQTAREISNNTLSPLMQLLRCIEKDQNLTTLAVCCDFYSKLVFTEQWCQLHLQPVLNPELLFS